MDGDSAGCDEEGGVERGEDGDGCEWEDWECRDGSLESG